MKHLLTASVISLSLLAGSVMAQPATSGDTGTPPSREEFKAKMKEGREHREERRKERREHRQERREERREEHKEGHKEEQK